MRKAKPLPQSMQEREAAADGNTDWWLRESMVRFAWVTSDGDMIDGVSHDDAGVRPAVWIDPGTSVEFSKLEVGDRFLYGTYEQDGDSVNGKEDIEWIVLDREDNRALVISEYGLDRRSYNETGEDVTWEDCGLRGWLNMDFFNEAFSEEEQVRILETTVKNPDNAETGTVGGNDTIDRMFLLSIDEAQQYFSSDEERRVFSTEYAEIFGDEDVLWQWWLRSPGDDQTDAANVNDDGTVDPDGIAVYYSNNDVRPAMWITLDP